MIYSSYLKKVWVNVLHFDEFTVQHRGGKGLRCYKITEKTGYVIGVKTIKPEEEIMLITTEGIVIRMKSDSISVIGRNTSGVKLINIDADSDIKVAKCCKGKIPGRG